jgi:hypothetical protein
MWTNTVGLKDIGKSVVVIVESHLVPVLVVMNCTESVMSAQGWATITAASAVRSTRRCQRAATVDAAAGTAVIAGRCNVVTVAAAGTVVGTPSVAEAECKRTPGFGAREQDDDVLHRVNRESVASINVGKKSLSFLPCYPARVLAVLNQ